MPKPSPFNVTETEFHSCVEEIAEAFSRGDLHKTEAQGEQLHFLVGSYRVRAFVSEVTHEPQGVQAPPPRDTSLTSKHEHQLLTGKLTELARSAGERPPAGLQLETLDPATTQRLRVIIGKAVESMKRLRQEADEGAARIQRMVDERAASR